MAMKSLLFRIFFLFISLYAIIPATGQSKAILSSRFFHPINKLDSNNTLNAIDELKPSKLDWTYTDNPTMLTLFKQRLIPFSIALNPQVPDSLSYTTKKFRIITKNGTPYIASWMRSWHNNNMFWGCVNNPGFVNLFFNKSKAVVDLGAYGIFVDDPLFNVQLQYETKDEIGCFCDFCINKYATQTKTLATTIRNQLLLAIKQKDSGIEVPLIKDYKTFQKNCVIAFLNDWSKKIKVYKPGIVLITNNFKGNWSDIYSIFDKGIAELPESDLSTNNLDQRFSNAKKLKKTQLFSLVSNDIGLNYYLMCYCFMNHYDYIIPWDVFVPTIINKQNRFYANTHEVAKLQKIFNDCIETNNVEVSSMFKITDKFNFKIYKSKSQNFFYVLLLKKDVSKTWDDYTTQVSTNVTKIQSVFDKYYILNQTPITHKKFSDSSYLQIYEVFLN